MVRDGTSLLGKRSLEHLMLRAGLGWLCADEAKLQAEGAQRWTQVSAKAWGGFSGWGSGKGLASLHGGRGVMGLVTKLLQ